MTWLSSSFVLRYLRVLSFWEEDGRGGCAETSLEVPHRAWKWLPTQGLPAVRVRVCPGPAPIPPASPPPPCGWSASSFCALLTGGSSEDGNSGLVLLALPASKTPAHGCCGRETPCFDWAGKKYRVVCMRDQPPSTQQGRQVTGAPAGTPCAPPSACTPCRTCEGQGLTGPFLTSCFRLEKL